MRGLSAFLEALARGVIVAGGAREHDLPAALERAREAWSALERLGMESYPCMVELDGIRFVYLWEENPAVVALMVWDDRMWQNIAFVPVPESLRKWGKVEP